MLTLFLKSLNIFSLKNGISALELPKNCPKPNLALYKKYLPLFFSMDIKPELEQIISHNESFSHEDFKFYRVDVSVLENIFLNVGF